MLQSIFATGLQIFYMLGMLCLLWGIGVLIFAFGSRGGAMLDYFKGGALMLLGTYFMGLARNL